MTLEAQRDKTRSQSKRNDIVSGSNSNIINELSPLELLYYEMTVENSLLRAFTPSLKLLYRKIYFLEYSVY